MNRLRIAFVFTFAMLTLGVSGSASNVVIANLSDIDFGAMPPTAGRLRQVVRLCIGLDDTGTYRVTPNGSGPSGAFELDGGIARLPYRVNYSDRPNGRGAPLQSGEPRGDFTTKAGIARSGCRRVTSRLTITIAGSDLEAMPSGRYRGALTLMVSPE